MKSQDGYRSLNAFSAAQNVQLNYNEQGQLVDGGEVAGAQAIMSMLTDDWGYPVAAAESNRTVRAATTETGKRSQRRRVAYHTLHSTQTVVLPADVEANGQVRPTR